MVGGMPEAVNVFIETNDANSVREVQREILLAYKNDISKHTTKEQSQRIAMVWNSMPSQLSKENKKFIYGVVKKGGRANEFELAIQWLIDAGLIIKVGRITTPSMPLKVYIQDTADVPEYYREVVVNAYQAWQRASEGLVRFEFVETSQEADMKCYFKANDNKDSIGVHAFSVNGNTITDSVIVFNIADNKGHSHDSKQLFSSALQEIGHSLGLTGKSPSIYDVMYPIGTKFNTEITPRDLKSLALLYSVSILTINAFRSISFT